MHEIGFAAENDFTELTDTANRIFTGKMKTGSYTYKTSFFQKSMPKLYRDSATAADHIIIRDDGKITGLAGVIPNTLHAFGKTLKFAGIGTVGTDAEYRGRGYMSEMMQYANSYLQKSKMDFAVLCGNRQRYEHFGYAPSGLRAVFELTPDNVKSALRELPAGRGGFGFSFYELEGRGQPDEIELIDRLHRQKNVWCERSTNKLADILRTWETQVWIILKNGALAGYLLGRDNGIFEIECEKDCLLIEILYDYMHQFHKRRLTLSGFGLYDPQKMHVLSSFAEDMLLCQSCRVQILNFQNVLSLFLDVKSSYSRLSDGTLRIRISDLAQQFQIEVRQSIPSVVPCCGTPDLELPALKATQLFFGIVKSLGNLGYELPACANSWFPLPLHIESADLV